MYNKQHNTQYTHTKLCVHTHTHALINNRHVAKQTHSFFQKFPKYLAWQIYWIFGKRWIQHTKICHSGGLKWGQITQWSLVTTWSIYIWNDYTFLWHLLSFETKQFSIIHRKNRLLHKQQRFILIMSCCYITYSILRCYIAAKPRIKEIYFKFINDWEIYFSTEMIKQ